jgi:hypothetical protein
MGMFITVECFRPLPVRAVLLHKTHRGHPIRCFRRLVQGELMLRGP